MSRECETERRRKTVSRILPVQISMWSQHLITVIPNEVEAATQLRKLSRRGQAFNPAAQLKGNMPGCLQPPREATAWQATALDMTNYS